MTPEETHGLCDGGCAPDECVCVSAKAVEMIDQLRAEIRCEERRYEKADDMIHELSQRAEKAEAEVKRLTVSRDQWKDACLDANALVQGAEAEVDTTRKSFLAVVEAKDHLQRLYNAAFLRHIKSNTENMRLRGLLDKAVLYWQIGKWTEPVGLDVLVEQALKEVE